VHDLAESIVGDITPLDGVTKDEKRRMEEEALRKIAADIGNASIGPFMLGLQRR
jgi:putative hydrolase of HD superfamily